MAESATEVTYRIQVNNWLAVQPVLQWYRNPGADRAVPDAKVIAMVFANTQPVSPFIHFGSNRSILKANTMPAWNSSPIALIAAWSARMA